MARLKVNKNGRLTSLNKGWKGNSTLMIFFCFVGLCQDPSIWVQDYQGGWRGLGTVWLLKIGSYSLSRTQLCFSPDWSFQSQLIPEHLMSSLSFFSRNSDCVGHHQEEWVWVTNWENLNRRTQLSKSPTTLDLSLGLGLATGHDLASPYDF